MPTAPAKKKPRKPIARKPAKRGPAPAAGRTLTEHVTVESAASPLKVDREKGIIYGVKVLGRTSKNTHDEDVSGTEYSPNAMRQACDLYEGMTVRTDHPADRSKPEASRSVYESFGQLRNCRVEGDAVRADLHYLKSHDLAEAVAEDVERGLGVYGLSHNARAGKERVDGGRLIIEEITLVRSVDLVDKPATNRNLWESHMAAKKKTTLRDILEARLPKLSKRRKAWARNILEGDDAAMDDAIGTEVEEEPDADDAMREAFAASGKAIVEKALAGELDMKEALGKLKDLFTTHDKLASAEEPTDVPESEDDEEKEVEESEDDDEGKDDKDKVESLAEVKRLKAELAARDLCESHDVKPSKSLLKALVAPGLTLAEQKELVTDFKGTKGGGAGNGSGSPRSRAPGRNVSESHTGGGSNGRGPAIPETAGGEMAFLRRG